MTEWRKVKLGDYCEITSSKRIFYNEYVESGVPFYRSKEIIEKAKGDTISTPLFISHARFEEIKESFGAPQKRDLLLTAVGSLGIPYLINDSNPFYFKDGNLIWFKSFNDDLNSEFLYYWFKTRSAFQMLDKIAIGSAQKALTISSIKQISIEIPARDIQDRIVTVLSRYDALIENYQRQIKLLEEAAQRLYKEWFVDLRFPGHQFTPIINNLPQSWQKKSAKDFFTMSIGKTPPRAESGWFSTDDKDVPWVSISDMKDVMFVNTTNERLTQEACDHFNVKIVPEGTILLSFKLTVGRVSIADKPMCTNEAIAHFMRDGDNWREYTLMYLRNYHYDSLGNTSGISKAVNSTIIKNMPFVMPSNDILDSFSKMSSPYINQIRNLSTQIRNLSEARDRLLPKLMSAEIEV